MSVKLELYQDIKAALQDLTFIKNVLHYNGQDLLNYEKNNSKRFPQSWIQISNVTWQPSQQVPYNQNRTQQQKSDTIIVTVYYASFTLLEDANLEIYELLECHGRMVKTIENIKERVEEGLQSDSSHQKQRYLEQILLEVQKVLLTIITVEYELGVPAIQ